MAAEYDTIFQHWKRRLEARDELEEHAEAAHEAGTHPQHAPGLLGSLQSVPLFVWTLFGLFGGMAAGYLFPELEPIGSGVKGGFGYVADAAPLIIFFTLTPALITMYRTSSAGKFAAYVVLGFAVSTALGGIFALLLSLLFFPDMTLGFGASGLGAILADLGRKTLELTYQSAPFRAIWAALLVATGLYFLGGLARSDAPVNPVGRMFRTIADIYDLIGVHGVAALGRLIKTIMPVALFAIGIFLTATLDNTLREAEQGAAGAVNAPWTAIEGYFVAVGVIVVITLLWLALVSLAITQYTRFPVVRLLRDYIAVVYPFAWATSSSSASIPLNIEAARKGLGVRKPVRAFVLPLGATVNLDGTMMSAVVTTIVAAKMVGYTPSVLDMVIALIPLVLITVGTPGIPGGLAIVAAPILATLLPLPAGTDDLFTTIFIAFGFGLNDQFRTAVNTLDNGLFALLLDKWWPERFEAGAEANPFLPSGHIETEGLKVHAPPLDK